MSNFSFNKIFILESLTPNELQTGTELEKRLNQWTQEQGIGCQVVTFQVHSRQDWDIAWNGIYTSIEKMDNVPIIHIEMHGNQTAIGIDRGANGIIPLPEVFRKVQHANVLSKNNIFLSLAVCMGLNVIRDLKIFEPMPFCGVLGSLETLQNDELLNNYFIFYKAFLSTLSLDKAKQIMEESGINAEKYNLYKPEEIFMNAYLGYLESYKTDEQIESKAVAAASEAGISFANDEARRRFIRDYRCTLLLTEGREYKHAVYSFFMFDRYPDILNRFVVPKNIYDFKKQAGEKGHSWLLEKRPLTFEDKKGISIQILHEVDEFCKYNGIKYSLAYGTMIGAIRHKGFIPWDDDVDIMMLRSDYEKFVRTFNRDSTKLFSVSSYATEKNFHYPMAKVSCNSTINDEMGFDQYGYSIDVFAIDKLPLRKEEYSKIVRRKKMFWYLFAIKASEWNKNVSFTKNLVWSVLKFVLMAMPYSCVHKMMLKDVRHFEGLSDYKLGCLSTPYGARDIFPKEYFSEFISIPYENTAHSVIKEYDKYLTSIYGNYMQLPPIESRVTHHNFDAYWK